MSDASQGAPGETVQVTRTEITLVPSNVWRVGLVLLGVVAVGLLLRFMINDGGSVIFTVLMSYFAALAMAPVVNRLSTRMRRGAATGIVMLVFAIFVVVFIVAFGSLLVGQLADLVSRIPTLIDDTIAWINSTFDAKISLESVLSSIGGGDVDFGSLASSIGLNILGVLGSVLGSVFGVFTFALFTFYFSAQMPQLQSYLERLFPRRARGVVGEVFRVSAQKTGGYVGARVLLAAVNSALTAVVFAVAGMPYWLPLALWTGIVAQFVPTIGTYIAIVLPVLVGALSPNPWLGVVALVWGLIYQQVENLTIEPKISARAVDVNPAVSFAAVMMGTALFGVAGAFLAVPVVAMVLSLIDTYVRRDELDELASVDVLGPIDPTEAEAVGSSG
ncbi:MAG: AI-2E family transporter [Actinobacteria bacterium]|jgi:predicted PurR-regulated permease PerM|nr:AI-2E family transporter [Actinomycetota bacterium]